MLTNDLKTVRRKPKWHKTVMRQHTFSRARTGRTKPTRVAHFPPEPPRSVTSCAAGTPPKARSDSGSCSRHRNRQMPAGLGLRSAPRRPPAAPGGPGAALSSGAAPSGPQAPLAPPAQFSRPRPRPPAVLPGLGLPQPPPGHTSCATAARSQRPGLAPPSPLMPPAANRKEKLRHERPPTQIQKASRRIKCAAHWLPVPPLLCKPPPHSASFRYVPPSSPLFLDSASLSALSDWMPHLPLAARRRPIGGRKFREQSLLRCPRAGC